MSYLPTIYLVLVLFSFVFPSDLFFSWWPFPGTLCPLAAFWANCSLGLLFSCHPETALSYALAFNTLLFGAHASLSLSLALLLIGMYPGSQEKDMGSKFSEFQHVR